MSWEIQGSVAGSADVDALLAAPTQAPSDAEALQVSEVGGAIKALLDANVVGGLVYVRAGGHANASGGPSEGAADEMVTITLDYDRKAVAAAAEQPDPAVPAVAETEATETSVPVEAAGQGADTAAPEA